MINLLLIDAQILPLATGGHQLFEHLFSTDEPIADRSLGLLDGTWCVQSSQREIFGGNNGLWLNHATTARRCKQQPDQRQSNECASHCDTSGSDARDSDSKNTASARWVSMGSAWYLRRDSAASPP